MSLEDLTQGCIDRMLEAEDNVQAVHDPVCQVLSVKKIQPNNAASANTPDRYRVIVSDGLYFAQAMLATQKKHLVEEGQLERNCLIRLTKYSVNNVQTRRILILLDLDVIHGPTAERLGAPANYEQRDANGAAPAGANGANGAAEQKPAVAAPRPGASAASAGAYRQQSRSANATSAPIYPIEALSPYQNKWTIKARVTSKSDIRHWSNARGEGKLFSVNLLDESGEIKATGFNDAVDKYYPLLQENKVYLISRAKVSIAKKQFSNLNSEYEISFERDTEIEECAEASDVPEIKYSFVPIDRLEEVEANQTCDVIGIIAETGELSEIISKASQKPVQKREITLVDQTAQQVRMTLWGKTAEAWGTSVGPITGTDDDAVVAFKGVKVGDFNGRSLSMFSSSTLMVNPDIPEAHGIKGWWDAEGKGSKGNFKAFSNNLAGGAAGGGPRSDEVKTIEQVKAEGLGMRNAEKPDFFSTRATVVYIKQENLFYTACPSDNCNKKVNLEGDGRWRCEKCDKTYPEPQYRYILAANVQDYTGQLWISGFNDIGERLIGMTANELNAFKETNESEFHSILHKAANKIYNFSCRAKQDTFNDTTRVRYVVSRASDVDFVKEGFAMVEAIRKYL